MAICECKPDLPVVGEHVSEGHFGGGMLQKKESGQEEKSWKDKMEEMISRSKQAKVNLGRATRDPTG